MTRAEAEDIFKGGWGYTARNSKTTQAEFEYSKGFLDADNQWREKVKNYLKHTAGFYRNTDEGEKAVAALREMLGEE